MCQTFLPGPVPRMKGRNREGRQARGWGTSPGFFGGDRHLEHTQSERRVRVWRLGQTDKTAREGLTSLVVQCLGQSTSKQGAWVLSMVGEPRCHIPCSVAKKKKARERCSQDPLFLDTGLKKRAPRDLKTLTEKEKPQRQCGPEQYPWSKGHSTQENNIKNLLKLQVVSIIGALGISP